VLSNPYDIPSTATKTRMIFIILGDLKADENLYLVILRDRKSVDANKKIELGNSFYSNFILGEICELS
jgi:hypothetical protein